jgi:hypothetical protein
VEETRNKNITLPVLKESMYVPEFTGDPPAQNFLQYSGTDALHLSEALDEEAINLLVNNGLNVRFRMECETWKQRKQSLRESFDSAKRREEESMKQNLADEATQLEGAIRQVVVNSVLQAFP